MTKKFFNKKKQRIGESDYNFFGSKMTIIKYKNSKEITVEFENGYKVETSYGNFKNNNVKNPYDKTICNVGFLGEGVINCFAYKFWVRMLRRCYDEKNLQKDYQYIKCSVCEEWHNFQNFAKWFDKNYYECDGQTMDLDKDILNKNNVIYSPKNCVFVPHRINSLFTKSDSTRGKYPIGVSYKKRNDKFVSQCNVYNEIKQKHEPKHLGLFNTPEEAFLTYKTFKESYIKEVADEYKDKIPNNLYKAMYKWMVEITD